jgi:hypothetical protein
MDKERIEPIRLVILRDEVKPMTRDDTQLFSREKSAAELFRRKDETSRRDMLTGPLALTGMLTAAHTLQAQAEANSAPKGDGLRGQTFQDLQFVRRESRDPGVVFDGDTGFLVGFGENLLQFDALARKTILFADGHGKGHALRKLVESSMTTDTDIDVNIPKLAVGTRATFSQTIQDRVGRQILSQTLIESVNDPPDDFLVTGFTRSDTYTGSFFNVTTTIGAPEGEVFQHKTTVDLLTGSLPFGTLIVPGPLFSNPPSSLVDFASEDPDALLLLGIASQILDEEYEALDVLIPNDIQVDSPWGWVARQVVKYVAKPIIRGAPSAARWVARNLSAAARQVWRGLRWVWSHVLDNALWDLIKFIFEKAFSPCGTPTPENPNPRPCPMVIE